MVIKSITGSIQVLDLVVVDAMFTAAFPAMLGCSKVSWMKDCVTPLGRVLASRARTSALVFCSLGM
ncbi:hypothetical protein A2U01_0116283 [Trifolium medium]|uniref:Uncharacterized protein n=1 Tax=Trifolium medium TaxID=97028 RepID=A0A392W7W2_9FABA|nr:hypothetical protein [Trifolium medium]